MLREILYMKVNIRPQLEKNLQINTPSKADKNKKAA